MTPEQSDEDARSVINTRSRGIGHTFRQEIETERVATMLINNADWLGPVFRACVAVRATTSGESLRQTLVESLGECLRRAHCLAQEKCCLLLGLYPWWTLEIVTKEPVAEVVNMATETDYPGSSVISCYFELGSTFESHRFPEPCPCAQTPC